MDFLSVTVGFKLTSTKFCMHDWDQNSRPVELAETGLIVLRKSMPVVSSVPGPLLLKKREVRRQILIQTNTGGNYFTRPLTSTISNLRTSMLVTKQEFSLRPANASEYLAQQNTKVLSTSNKEVLERISPFSLQSVPMVQQLHQLLSLKAVHIKSSGHKTIPSTLRKKFKIYIFGHRLILV